jgi:hypothetical protein
MSDVKYVSKNVWSIEVNIITVRSFLRIHVYDEKELKEFVQ